MSSDSSMQAWSTVNRYRQLGQVIANRGSFATTLTVCMIELYGTEYFDWHPETIRRELWDDLQITIPEVNLDKIMAIVTVMTTDSFYQNLPRFIYLCNVLSDYDFDPSVFDPATADEIAWAITEILLLDPPEDPDNAFCDEIRYYIGEAVTSEGLVNPPDVLRLAMFSEDRQLDPVAEFADDPTMYGAFWQRQQSLSEDIRQMLMARMTALLDQLERLPLVDGNTKDLVQRMRRSATAPDENYETIFQGR